MTWKGPPLKGGGAVKGGAMIAKTRGQAIKAKCKDCAYDPLDKGTWKMQVEMCGGTKCPLYPFRPKSAKVPAEQTPPAGAEEEPDV